MRFGVANGGLLLCGLPIIHIRILFYSGFDTFSGLPEDYGPFKKGDMSMEMNHLKTDDKRAAFYQGLFQQTLPGFLTTFIING